MKKILALFLLVFLVVGLVPHASALPSTNVVKSVGLAWNPSPDSIVNGYRVYYGVASRSYSTMIDAGSNTNLVISNLVMGTTYYFAATAYTTNGLESDFSAEAIYTVPGIPTPPSNLQVTPVP